MLLLAVAAVLLQDPPASPSPDDAKYVQFEMEDGSILMGEILLDSLTVKTRYGELTVPVQDIRGLRPGFDSKPDFRVKIKSLVETLSDGALESRDAAEKKILGMGLRVRDEVRRYSKDADGERKVRLTRILTAFEELEADSEDNSPVHVLQSEDEIITASFTMRGDVQPKKFNVKTRYGKVTVELDHLRELIRRESGRVVEKRVEVTAANFCALEAKESGFAVERGERIVIRAEGSLTMTPWGGNVTSSPDGCAQCGGSDQGAQIMSGTLMMRIGKNGKWIKVGSKANLRATASGNLQFGIAINAQYARGQSYPGEYTIKIKVGE
ncbi:MAG TPA: hypothetical protein VFC86_02430 [Planctomycetota bacterium]|nr:hypothetical protein [Planctomycetota bacterium]